MDRVAKEFYEMLCKFSHNPKDLHAYLSDNAKLNQMLQNIYSSPDMAIANEPAQAVCNGPSPIPKMDDIRAIEVTLFDNSRIIKYAVEIEVWSYSADKMRKGDWRGVAILWDEKQARSQYRKTVKRSKNADHGPHTEDSLVDIFAADFTHVGLIHVNVKGRGTLFYENHVVACIINQTSRMVESFMLFAPDTQVVLKEGFVNTDVNDVQFMPIQKDKKVINVACQARVSYDISLDKWASVIKDDLDEGDKTGV